MEEQRNREKWAETAGKTEEERGAERTEGSREGGGKGEKKLMLRSYLFSF